MDRSRKSSREGNEATFQYKSRQEKLREDELIEEKLTQLLAYIAELSLAPAGRDQLQRRSRLFGDCRRGADESTAGFYAKLHHWLEREIPQSKSPLHPPRQTDSTAIQQEIERANET